MKILIIYPDLSFRGGERIFIDFANSLNQRNHNVIFITARVDKNIREISKPIKFIASPSYLRSIFQNNFLFTLFSPIYLFISLLNNIKDADLIYASESFISLWPSIITGLIFKKRVIVSIFELGGSSKKHQGIKNLNYELFNTINALFIKNAYLITSINPSIVHILKKAYGLKNVIFIPAGLDFSLFNEYRRRNSKKHRYESKQVIIMPGIIHPGKKQDFALEILSEVKKKIPNIHLIFIGGGKQIHLNRLKMLIKKKNLQDYTKITGYIKERELPDYYTYAKMTLMCGPVAGLTIIESLYMGTMPIYPTSGKPPLGPSEPFKLGIIIDKYDSKLFAKKIINYLKNPENLAKKLRKEKKFVEENFDVNHTIEKTLQLTVK